MNETNEAKRASERARLYSSGRLIYDLRSSMIVAHLVHSSLTFDTDIAGGHRENEGGDTLSTHAIETRWRANEQANQRRRKMRNTTEFNCQPLPLQERRETVRRFHRLDSPPWRRYVHSRWRRSTSARFGRSYSVHHQQHSLGFVRCAACVRQDIRYGAEDVLFIGFFLNLRVERRRLMHYEGRYIHPHRLLVHHRFLHTTNRNDKRTLPAW